MTSTEYAMLRIKNAIAAGQAVTLGRMDAEPHDFFCEVGTDMHQLAHQQSSLSLEQAVTAAFLKIGDLPK